MPGFNGSGPQGQGPGTGWGRGPCGAGLRRGFGRRGGGFGRWGNDFPAASGTLWSRGAGYASRPDEAEARRAEKAYLQGELEAIQKRLAELESQA
jgi:hypothetical protein